MAGDETGGPVRARVGRQPRHHDLDHRPSFDRPDAAIVLAPPAVDPDITDDQCRTVLEMMAKGTFAMITWRRG